MSIDAKLLEEAKSAGINLSAVLEGRLAELLKAERERRWREEHREAIAELNRLVEERGLWSDGRRLF